MRCWGVHLGSAGPDGVDGHDEGGVAPQELLHRQLQERRLVQAVAVGPQQHVETSEGQPAVLHLPEPSFTILTLIKEVLLKIFGKQIPQNMFCRYSKLKNYP